MIWLAFSIVSLLYLPLNLASPTTGLAKRATCVPKSAQNAGTDDVPAITAAFVSCGAGGTIQIPAGVEFTIRSVLDFSACKGCQFQIEGTMKVSDDLTYWEGRTAIFYTSGVTGMTMTWVSPSQCVKRNLILKILLDLLPALVW